MPGSWYPITFKIDAREWSTDLDACHFSENINALTLFVHIT